MSGLLRSSSGSSPGRKSRLQQLQDDAQAAPDNDRVLLALADAYADADRYADALGMYWDVVELYRRQRHFLKALAVLRRLDELEPHSRLTAHRMAECLEHLGRFREASEAYTRAAELSAQAGFPMEAVEWADKARSVSPRGPLSLSMPSLSALSASSDDRDPLSQDDLPLVKPVSESSEDEPFGLDAITSDLILEDSGPIEMPEVVSAEPTAPGARGMAHVEEGAFDVGRGTFKQLALDIESQIAPAPKLNDARQFSDRDVERNLGEDDLLNWETNTRPGHPPEMLTDPLGMPALVSTSPKISDLFIDEEVASETTSRSGLAHQGLEASYVGLEGTASEAVTDASPVPKNAEQAAQNVEAHEVEADDVEVVTAPAIGVDDLRSPPLGAAASAQVFQDYESTTATRPLPSLR